MGTYLSTPITEKCDESGESLECTTTATTTANNTNNTDTNNDNNNDNNNGNGNGDVPVEWGVVDMQGWRKSMEDSHTAVTTGVPLSNNKVTTTTTTTNNKQQQQNMARVFGVYDGHGGAEVARFCQYYFVDVLMNQPSWKENEFNMPLTGDDSRVPLPPPPPPPVPVPVSDQLLGSDNIYNGDGNEIGYRTHHLLNAIKTPVGKSLREAFHSMDRMIDDPSRRNEIGILRSNKTIKGATKKLDNGYNSIPPITNDVVVVAPDFYTKNKQSNYNNNNNTSSLSSGSSTTNVVVIAALAADVFDDADVLPVNKNIDDHAALPSAAEDDTSNEGLKIQAQADKSLSTTVVMSLEEAEILKNEINEYEKKMFNNSNKDKDNKDAEDVNEMDDDDDSNEAVGIEEAIILDSNIDDDYDDDDDNDDDCDGVTAEDSKTLPSVTTATTTTPPPPPPGGKVTTMLQKILSLGGAAAQAAAGTALPIDEAGDDANDANNINENDINNEAPSALTTSNDDDCSSPTTTTTTTTTSGTGTPQVVYPRSIEVSRTDVRHPSVIHNGRLVCNLPDHPIHAGATAVVAVITGKILTVANAGDSRAVLCRRRHRSRIVTDDGTDDSTDVDTGHYAFPLSYDHKPSQTHELNRILCSGGFVNHFGRINGNLNLSRSIGDLKYKQVPGIPPEDQMITAEPDIMQIVLKDDDEFIILGCDGIWDCLSNEQAVNFVANRIQTKTPVEIGTEMLDEIISDDPRITQGIGGDNMTIMIIDLQTSNRLRRKITTSDADPLLGRGGGGFGNDADSSSKENDNDVNNNTTSEVAAME